jgi:hypothetical protein
VLPIVGKPVAGLIQHVFPINRQPDPEARVLDTLDWYSPKYQSKHTYEQVFRWFESCGLVDLAAGEDPNRRQRTQTRADFAELIY